jgi:predicted AAA+ superfamily ATPase
MLLELYLAASEERPISVPSAAVAASVSSDTAARWLELLEEHGLVERLYAGTEMNRAVFRLSDTAFAQMTRLLEDLS